LARASNVNRQIHHQAASAAKVEHTGFRFKRTTKPMNSAQQVNNASGGHTLPGGFVSSATGMRSGVEEGHVDDVE
jgi:hypothetical protein